MEDEDRQQRQRDRQQTPVRGQQRMGVREQPVETGDEIIAERADRGEEVDVRDLALANALGGVEIDRRVPVIRAERQAQRQQ